MGFSREVSLALAFTLASLTPGVRAQSLADVARQEAERRKAIKTEAKVYTNKDIHPAPGDGTAPPNTDSAPGRAVEAPQPATSDAPPADVRDGSQPNHAEGDQSDATPRPPDPGEAAGDTKRDQAYWSGRLKALQTALDRDQTHLDALQSRVSALAADFVNRDDPAQRAVIAADRQKAIAELERLKKQTEDDRQAIVSFEEQARRAAVPPGWLR